MEDKPQKLEFTDEEFASVKDKAEAYYKTVDPVTCPYFQEKIHFNVEGLEHIKFKSWNRARDRKDQFMRLKLIHLAPKILGASRTLQGIWETMMPVRIKSRGQWIKHFKKVSYFEFIAVLDNKRVKVIVKQIEGGVKFFWTLIPYWRMNVITNRRVLHDGNPEID